MKTGVAFAIVRSITAKAVITLIPPGRFTLALAVEALTVPASAPLETVVREPRAGVSITCMTVPNGIFEASSATFTGFAVAEGTITSGTAWSEPAGLAGAFTPPTEAIRNCGEFGGVIGCGKLRLAMLVGVVVPVKPRESYASRRM